MMILEDTKPIVKQVPTIGTFIDDEEEALYNLIESDDYVHPPSQLTDERKAVLEASANAKLKETRIKISIRVPALDLERLKTKAAQEGLPYQTYINSLLHKAAISA